jgi:hypothetical protein
MRVLFDQGTPVPLRGALAPHEVETAFERGRSTLTNGELLDAAERAGFDVLVTADLHLRYQQNLTSRRLAIVVLSSTSWPRMERVLPAITRAVDGALEGSYTEVPIP